MKINLQYMRNFKKIITGFVMLMLFSTLSACSDNTTETTNHKVVKVRYVSSNYIITNTERGFYHQTTSYS